MSQTHAGYFMANKRIEIGEKDKKEFLWASLQGFH